MILLLINKTTRAMTMGVYTPVDKAGLENGEPIFLEDIIDVKLNVSQDGQAMPFADDYPTPIIKDFLTAGGNEKYNGYEFKQSEHRVYKEEHLKQDLLDWFTSVNAKKNSNIEIITDASKSGIIL